MWSIWKQETRVKNARLSNDGTKIAFTYGTELHIMDSNGENLEKIKNAEYIDWFQVLSPDADKLIYIEEHKGEHAFTPIPQYLKILTLSSNEEKDISPFHYTELFVESGEQIYNKRYFITSWRRR